MTSPDWIAVDWGTSNLRVWAIDADGAPLESKFSEDGMNKLAPKQFEAALIGLIEPWLAPQGATEVIACGMVGSRQGWLEAPYRLAPCAPPVDLSEVATRDKRISVHICAGISQADPPDVMRGEETQIAGLLAAQPDFCGTVCLPGTHSKWVKIDAGQILGFVTFMTGEIYELLTTRSVLRHSMGTSGWDSAAYQQGASEALHDPVAVDAALFGLRAKSLLGNQTIGQARARLSGLLVGMEVAGARRFWQDHQVVVIGAADPARHYADVLQIAGVSCAVHDAEAMCLAGLQFFRRRLARK